MGCATLATTPTRALTTTPHPRAQSTFKACLEGKEYTARRNALSVLKRLIPVFPVVDTHMNLMKKALEKVGAAAAAAAAAAEVCAILSAPSHCATALPD